MPDKTFRAAAAATTFIIGLAVFRLAGAPAPIEIELADRLVPDSEISVAAPPLVGAEESDAEEVYSVVVREMFRGDRAGRRVVVAPKTAVYLYSGNYASMWPQVGAETLTDFGRKTETASTLIPPLPHLAASQVFLDSDDFSRLFRDDGGGWKQFFGRYPNSPGYVRLSAVGFNVARDEAFLYASLECGDACGTGWRVALRKGPGGWSVRRKEAVWVS